MGDKGFENDIKGGGGNFKYKGGTWQKGGIDYKGEIDVYFVIFLKRIVHIHFISVFQLFS